MGSSVVNKLKPIKTEAILYTLWLLEHLPNITFDRTTIRFVEEHKHLGLTLSSNGQWHSHIDNIISSGSKVLGINLNSLLVELH